MRRAAACAALCALACMLGSSQDAAVASVQAWGFNESAQLGSGSSSLNGCRCVETPVNVIGLTAPTQIAAGLEHTLALQTNGTVMAWGGNEQGQLGDGTTSPRSTPKQVPGLASAVAVAAGGQFSLALLENGTVLAWGNNGQGELGNGTTTGPGCGGTCKATPAPVPGLTNVIAISAAGGNGLALLANGTVMTWGADDSGQTGDGTGSMEGCKCIDAPRPVPGVSGAMAISAGAFGGIALLADGSVQAWGANGNGQLGTGVVTAPMIGSCACLGASKATAPAAGALAAGSFDGLALAPNGEVLAWGSNFFGQLGNGSVSTTPACDCIPTPAPATGVNGAQAIASGERHSLALLANGEVDAWGSNFQGALGNGKTEESNPKPTPVLGVAGATAVFAGVQNSFALVGPTRPLKISFTGAGSAHGAVGGAGVLCRATCTVQVPLGQVKILRAEGSGSGRFAGFTETCQGTAPCSVAMNVLHDVTATFGAPTGTRISKAKINGRAGSALFTFTAPAIGAVTGFQCALVRPVRGGHKTKKRKPRQPHFASCKAPVRYRHLPPGHYTFEVRALDIVGADPHPAKKTFVLAR